MHRLAFYLKNEMVPEFYPCWKFFVHVGNSYSYIPTNALFYIYNQFCEFQNFEGHFLAPTKESEKPEIAKTGLSAETFNLISKYCIKGVFWSCQFIFPSIKKLYCLILIGWVRCPISGTKTVAILCFIDDIWILILVALLQMTYKNFRFLESTKWIDFNLFQKYFLIPF